MSPSTRALLALAFVAAIAARPPLISAGASAKRWFLSTLL